MPPRKRAQRDQAEGLVQHDMKLRKYYEGTWYQCDECFKWRHLTEELGEEEGFRCDMELGQGGCEVEEDTDWIFEPGFHGAHNYSELDDAEACQHMFCENALTHWIHKFSGLGFWKKNRDVESQILKAIAQCKRLPRDGVERVRKLQSIFECIYKSLNRECLNEDYDDIWAALKEDLDQATSTVDVYVIGWRVEEELVNWNWDPAKKSQKRTHAGASASKRTKSTPKRQQKQHQPPLARRNPSAPVACLQQPGRSRGEQGVLAMQTKAKVSLSPEFVHWDRGEAENEASLDAARALGGEGTLSSWRRMLKEEAGSAVREPDAFEEMLVASGPWQNVLSTNGAAGSGAAAAAEEDEQDETGVSCVRWSGASFFLAHQACDPD